MHDNPKAAAKAAKAYAKATRPWYKKKRFIIPVALIALIVLVAALGGGEETTAAADDTDTTSESSESTQSDDTSSAEVGSSDAPAPPGTPARNKSAQYTVDSVEVRDSLGDFGNPPAGKYVVVTLSIENVKDETIQMSMEDFVLEVDGTEIASSSEAWMLDNAISYEDISPGLTKQGTIVFDVKPELAGQGVIKAQAFISMDEPVYLSLQ